MSLAGYDRKVAVVLFNDPLADMRIPALKVPTGHTYTVEQVTAVISNALTAATDNYVELSLENAGQSGTAQTLISGTAGGTAGWAANTPQALTITAGAGDLTEGQYLNIRYNETGTVAPTPFTVFIEYVDGVGAKA